MDYDWKWKERPNGEYADGCDDNYWWYCYNKVRAKLRAPVYDVNEVTLTPDKYSFPRWKG